MALGMGGCCSAYACCKPLQYCESVGKAVFAKSMMAWMFMVETHTLGTRYLFILCYLLIYLMCVGRKDIDDHVCQDENSYEPEGDVAKAVRLWWFCVKWYLF